MMTIKVFRRPHRRGRRLLLALPVLAALVAFFLWQQNGICTQTVQINDPDLPAAFDGLRIVHLSDLHGKEFGPDNQTLLDRVAELRPDLIVITGDLIDRAAQMEHIPVLAEGLVEIAPTYYVTGNHEWAVRRMRDWKQMLTDCGVQVLSNQYQMWTKQGQTLAIAGVDDPNGPADQKTGEQLRGEIDADYTILLSHRDAVTRYAQWGYDLTLCGHGHGGILRLPLVDQGVFSTDHTFFPTYDGGLYAIGQGNWCFVSRGLGSNTVPIHAFRLFNRPDLPLLVLGTTE